MKYIPGFGLVGFGALWLLAGPDGFKMAIGGFGIIAMGFVWLWTVSQSEFHNSVIGFVVMGVMFFAGGGYIFSGNPQILPSGGMSETQAHNSPWIYIIAGIVLVGGISLAITMRRDRYARLDWSVDNTALAYDPNFGCVLVEARNTHKIEGDMRHVPGNLPGHILYYGRSKNGLKLYVWDYYHMLGTSGDPENGVPALKKKGLFNWIYFEQEMEIVPRGAGKNWSGALADMMAGYDYENYVLPKGTRPDISAPGVTKLRG